MAVPNKSKRCRQTIVPTAITAAPKRRRLIDPTTCNRDYTADEIAFMRAVDDYKRSYKRPFPTCSEILQITLALGYRKVAKPIPMSQLVEARGKLEDIPLPEPDQVVVLTNGTM